MPHNTRRWVATTAATALTLGACAVPALAGDTCPPPPTPPKKCNSGNGNGSDVVTFIAGFHCYGGDPGMSYFHNRGGDEIPSSGGIPNAGGNNVD